MRAAQSTVGWCRAAADAVGSVGGAADAGYHCAVVPVAEPDRPRASLVASLLSRSAYFADLLTKNAPQVVGTEHNQKKLESAQRARYTAAGRRCIELSGSSD